MNVSSAIRDVKTSDKRQKRDACGLIHTGPLELSGSDSETAKVTTRTGREPVSVCT